MIRRLSDREGFGRCVQVLLESGDDVCPPSVCFEGQDLQFELLIEVEEFVDLSIGCALAQRIASPPVGADEKNTGIVVGMRAGEEREDIALLVLGKTEFLREHGQSVVGTALNAEGLGCDGGMVDGSLDLQQFHHGGP